MEILTLIGTAIAVIASAISVVIALKKTKPEIQNTEANTEKTRTEIIRLYSDELRLLKSQQLEENKRTEEKINELEFIVLGLKDEITKQKSERKEETLKYREFIQILLSGISRLTGQIQIDGKIPVWLPPVKTPFDSS